MTDMTERSAGNLHDLVCGLTRGLAPSTHRGCLLLAGHLSDWQGRRRGLMPALALQIVAGVVFVLWPSLPGLLLALLALLATPEAHRRMSPRPRYHPRGVAVLARAALTQTLTASRTAHQLLAAAIPALVAVLGLLTIAAWLPSPSFGVFLAEDIVVGAGAGLMFKGAIATVAEIAAPEGRRAIPSRLQPHPNPERSTHESDHTDHSPARSDSPRDHPCRVARRRP
jgi:MFS family permease